MKTFNPDEYKLSGVFMCPECGKLSKENIINVCAAGWPVYAKHHPDLPDLELSLISFVLEDKS